MTVAAFTSIRRIGCGRCESVSLCVTAPGGGDEHRRVRTEEQQRGEVDDEGRRHGGPVLRGRLLHREGGGQNRRQDQPGEFKGPVRLRPAREPKEHSRPDRDRRKRNKA